MPTYQTDVPRHGYPGLDRSRRHQKHRETVMRKNNGICWLCLKDSSDAIDHMVPVAWGGSDEIANLAPAHSSCNSSKGAAKETGPDDFTWHYPDMWIDGYGPKWNPEVEIEDMEDTREGIGQRLAISEYRAYKRRRKAAWHARLGLTALLSPVVFVIAMVMAATNEASNGVIGGLAWSIIGIGCASVIAWAATADPNKGHFNDK